VAAALAVERLVLDGDGVDGDAVAGVGLQVLDEVLGVGVVVLGVEVVAVGCADELLRGYC
jgi:hypothetical protein